MGRKRTTPEPESPVIPATQLPQITGKTFVFGKFLASSGIEAGRAAIVNVGANIEEKLSNNTNYLILERVTPQRKSRLEKQADTLNENGAAIQILDRVAFLALLGIEPHGGASTTVKPTAKLSPAAARKRYVDYLLSGSEGVETWNRLEPDERRQAEHFRKVDLRKAKLREVILTGLDFSGAMLDEASLIEAKLDYADLRGAMLLKANLRGADLRCGKFGNARFDGANLKDASLRVGSFRSTSFRNADLTGADLCYADVCGADFTGATFENTTFEKAKYDSGTLWPSGFKPGEDMERMSLPADEATPRMEASRPAGEIDVGTFVQRLESRVGKTAPGARVVGRVKEMLKGERFRLFARVESDQVLGVVKSQNDTDPSAVYSCRLTSTGLYDCYSPKLPVCGGMKYGGPCKHLLVLLVGLVRAGELDATTADWWISQTKKTHRRVDEEVLYETLLQYKGAQAGEIDWRPTETVPEDYYAL